MAHKFDASTKQIFEWYLPDLVSLIGRTPRAPMEIVESDLSVVSAAADKVVIVRETPPWIYHCEPHTYRENGLPGKLNMYGSILEHRTNLPVRTLLLLLRREADHPDLTGIYEQRVPGENPYRVFHYQVVRVWQEPLAGFLTGGIGLLPLAPLSDVTPEQMPGVIHTMEQRIEKEAKPEEVGTLWTATGLLMGLRYPPVQIAELLQGVHVMKESSFYHYIVAEGRVAEGRKILLRLGRKKFGLPSEEVIRLIESINDCERLESLSDRLLDVTTWEDLLTVP